MKKIISCIVIAAMVISLLIPAVSAVSETPESPVEISVTSDKSSYRNISKAVITVSVKNTGGKDLENIEISAGSDDYFVSGSSCFSSSELKAGESASYSFSVILSPDVSGLKFYEKWILYIEKLFFGAKEFSVSDNEDKSLATGSLTLNHGSSGSRIDVNVLFDNTDGYRVIYANDIRSFVSAASDLIYADGTDENIETNRAIVRSDNLNIYGYKPEVVITGFDDINIVQFGKYSETKNFVSAMNEKDDVDFAESDFFFDTDDPDDSQAEGQSECFALIYRWLFGSDDSDENTPTETWGADYMGTDLFADYISANNLTSDAVVAVVDTGIDTTHSDFSGRLVEGYDFVQNDNDPSVSTFQYNFSSTTNHGTHVAGIIAACTKGTNVKIMPVRAGSVFGSFNWVISCLAIAYAADMGADVINCSFGETVSSASQHYALMEWAINYAVEKGSVCTLAAGNGDSSGNAIPIRYNCPAHITTPGCITVGAIDSSGQVASYSNYGSELDVVAPGVDVYSCRVGGGYVSDSGTSMAAPHIAAIAALYKIIHPDALPYEIENYVKSSTYDLGDAGYDVYYGYGVPVFGQSTVSKTAEDDYLFDFGSYPQSEVTDSNLVSTLSTLITSWTSYGYYSGDGNVGSMQQSSYMNYCDVTYNGRKYRAVTFSSYRPLATFGNSSLESSDTIANSEFQSDNGYNPGTIYWFRFDPIQWRILDKDTGLILSETIIDSQPFCNTVYKNTDKNLYSDSSFTKESTAYATSSIRQWLNNDFYNTAFSDSEKQYIKTSSVDVDGTVTNDKVFLLSADEVNDSASLKNGLYRQANSTSYAASQGLMVNTSVSSSNSDATFAYWYLRNSVDSGNVYCVSEIGAAAKGASYLSCMGIRPAMNVDLSCFS